MTGADGDVVRDKATYRVLSGCVNATVKGNPDKTGWHFTGRTWY